MSLPACAHSPAAPGLPTEPALQPIVPPISISLFDLFKIGPGPSSSHTMAPMLAGFNFLQLCRELPEPDRARADRVEVRLFGSLSATGVGHGTHRAILAGLAGYEPATCHPEVLSTIERGSHIFDLGVVQLPLHPQVVIFDALQHPYPYNNTLVATLHAGDAALASREYYSVGGGFLQWKGWEPETRGTPLHRFTTSQEALAASKAAGISLDTMMLENERAITGQSHGGIVAGLAKILQTMVKTVERGLAAEGVLPGPIGLQRKAKSLWEKAEALPPGDGRLLYRLNAYALAGAEENAAGHTIVTAPTAGAAGVVPAMVVAQLRDMHTSRETVIRGLAVAGLVGMLCKANASIAGAEVGCQGEVGVAAAMAAALAAHCMGHPAKIIENAAESALEHHLGLTCDPVGGYVQIPCIERNAMGAVKALNAAIIAASVRPAAHMVSLDWAIRAMAATGRDMPTAYKETSQGGLAAIIEC